MEYLIEPKDIGKSVSGKHSQKRFDSTKRSATDVSKTALKREFKKTAGATFDLIGNKISDKITNTSSQNVVEFNTTLQMKSVIPREIYISP